jgi:hypothetical protein
MSTKNKILWLRIACWVGIVTDAIGAVMMLFPQLYSKFSSIDFESDAGFFYAQRNHLALMVGWTVLLFWADRKPLERKGVVLITLLVIVGYTIFLIYTIIAGFASLKDSLDELVREVLMIALFAFSYFNARDAEVE